MEIQLYTIIPFILMLLSIAVCPILFNNFWEENKNKLIVALILGIPTSIYLIYMGFGESLKEEMIFDYIPFIVLLGALFVITGGIFLSGDIQAKPSINTLFLGIGAVLASLMGTTGAAMLLIRPVIQTNKERKFKIHTILFFIAIVANCGGLLTPLGDPPLFMLYLRGAPFAWFFKLLPEWVFMNGILLLIYFLFDSYYYKKESIEDLKKDKMNISPIKLKGNLNFVWLAGVVLSVAFLNEQYLPFVKQNHYFGFIREAVIVLMTVLSIFFTSKSTRKSNNFTWEPIKEVAYLFLGIFITMTPCLIYLKTNASNLGIETPTQFYFSTGLLSAFLDNTPTAVTFHSLALGLFQQSADLFNGIPIIAKIPETLLRAISISAVFFGSMTYIGNGPNFMVKSVAEENNIKMPDFFSYMIKFSLIILLPLFILVSYLFI